MIFAAAMAAFAGQAAGAPPAPTVAVQAPAASAQPSTTVRPVTVTAPTESDRARSRSFIESYAAPTAKLDRYARWSDPPCVVVAGLAPAQIAAVKARVEAVARAAGLKVAGAGCRPNVEIEFATQPQVLVDQIVAKTPEILGYQPGVDVKALKTMTRPIQAWYMTASRGGVKPLDLGNTMNFAANPYAAMGVGRSSLDLGAPNPGIFTSARPPSPNAAGWAATNSNEVRNGRVQPAPRSHVTTTETLDAPDRGSALGCNPQALAAQGSACQSVFRNVLVVVDVGKAQDQSVTSLTDYVAMLALSQPRSLDGCMTLASIIDLLAAAPCPGRDPPDGLTPADTAYLTALYVSDPLANKTMQQSVMSARMAGDLVKAEPVAAEPRSGEVSAPAGR
jgi:hypothetical protein